MMVSWLANSVSDPGWIRIHSGQDPDPGGKKCSTKIEKKLRSVGCSLLNAEGFSSCSLHRRSLLRPREN
jgi:hypothetical protein